jgi:hypothetical protein
MSSKAITEQREETSPVEWERLPEQAPSILREDEPAVARWVGYIGLLLTVLGAVAMILNAFGRNAFIFSGLDTMFLTLGLGGLLFHASHDRDQQVRMLYGLFGLLWILFGIVAFVYGISTSAMGWFLGGSVGTVLGLLFLLCFLRYETSLDLRTPAIYWLGGAGTAMAAVGFLGGAWKPEFLMPYGAVLGVLGLVYLWAFISVRTIADDLAYRAGTALGVVGVVVFLTALFRTAVYPLFFSLNNQPAPYLVPGGVTFMGLGLLYAGLAVALVSDTPFVVLTRRELSAFFYSPVAYFVLIGLVIMAWGSYFMFLLNARGAMIEPIVRGYVWGLMPVLCMLGIVPLLTMRLMSEEHRAKTLELLLTAPVNEVTIVLSKFTAALLFFLIAWLPWLLFLVDLRIENGKPFDGRPLLSWFVALMFMGSSFISMGLFFSSLTSNQIISAVLTAAGMLFLTVLGLMRWMLEDSMQGSDWVATLGHVSYLQFWYDSVGGALSPRLLLFQASTAVFWLFLTVKVLESRKWR